MSIQNSLYYRILDYILYGIPLFLNSFVKLDFFSFIKTRSKCDSLLIDISTWEGVMYEQVR